LGIGKIVLVALTIGMLSSFGVASAVGASNPSIFEILSNGGDITFIGAGSTTKMIVIGPESFVGPTFTSSTEMGPNAEFVVVLPGNARVHAPADLPDGATITGFECKMTGEDINTQITCILITTAYSDGTVTVLSTLSTSTNTPSVQTLTDSSLSELVDRDMNRYHIIFEGDLTCGSCKLFAVKITYTVPSGMIVGGTFYPVDNVSLVLAYGLVNSWWMAPIGLGIGVGIYLVKKRF